MKIKSKQTVYNFELSEIKNLIAKSLEVKPEQVTVTYVLHEVDADPMDRYPGRMEVYEVEVTVDNLDEK